MDGSAGNPSAMNTPGARAVPRVARALAIAALVLAAGVLAGLWIAHPRGWIPACPTWRFLGVHCPGCGSTRSVHHLLNGRFGDAVRHNALMILIGVPAGAAFAWWLARIAWAGERPGVRVMPRWVGWGIVALVVVFALARNIPGAPFDGLRPPAPGAGD